MPLNESCSKCSYNLNKRGLTQREIGPRVLMKLNSQVVNELVGVLIEEVEQELVLGALDVHLDHDQIGLVVLAYEARNVHARHAQLVQAAAHRVRMVDAQRRAPVTSAHRVQVEINMSVVRPCRRFVVDVLVVTRRPHLAAHSLQIGVERRIRLKAVDVPLSLRRS